MDRVRPGRQRGINRVERAEFVDGTQRMDPSVLVRARLAVVGAVEVADQPAFVCVAEHRLHRGSLEARRLGRTTTEAAAGVDGGRPVAHPATAPLRPSALRATPAAST